MSHLLWNCWHFLSSDRGIALSAIVVGIVGILRAEWLFEKLYKREKYIKEAMLQEATNVLVSYAAFSRALQAIDLDPSEMGKDGAFALLTAYRFQQIVNTKFTPEEFAALRKTTRTQVDDMGRVYAEQLIASGLGSLKQGIVFAEPR